MKAKRLIFSLVAVYLTGSVLISGYYWYNYQYYVKTNDARAKVDLSLVTAPVTGKVYSLDVRENQEVKANEILGFMQALNSSASSETRIPLIAPASGRVMRIGAAEGEIVTNGQNLVAIADLQTAYVEARLTETEATRVRVGQTVDVRLDTESGHTYPGVVSLVEGVTEKAVWPIVSLVPARQQPREEELVPVRIQVKDARLIPGTNASIKIRVRGDSDALF
ncbi:efflux RND transporter periplasmic adaptor subunit [Brevibacillus sp. B_LB10_24]|uniref:efflux RND transporter periplasmic adaptor subunit n=1 Tax=Brevibacillus sp. B_LB10_24 TaxID=3380645 RepID=UPI0038BC86CD